MPFPLVTIGIPTRNRAGLLAETLASALGQDYPALEIVVSDNASTDGTAAVLAGCDDPRVVVLRQPSPLSMSANWNACLRAAKGELFLLLSDDDLLEPGAVSALVRPFVAADGVRVGVAWTACRVIDAGGQVEWVTTGGPAVEGALEFLEGLASGDRGTYFCGVLQRTEDARRFGFDDRFGLLVDGATWLRSAFLRGHMACVEGGLASYRLHPTNESGRCQIAAWDRDARRVMDACRELVAGPDLPRFDRAARLIVANTVSSAILHAFRVRADRRQLAREIVGALPRLLHPGLVTRALRERRKLVAMLAPLRHRAATPRPG